MKVKKWLCNLWYLIVLPGTLYALEWYILGGLKWKDAHRKVCRFCPATIHASLQPPRPRHVQHRLYAAAARFH